MSSSLLRGTRVWSLPVPGVGDPGWIFLSQGERLHPQRNLPWAADMGLPPPGALCGVPCDWFLGSVPIPPIMLGPHLGPRTKQSQRLSPYRPLSGRKRRGKAACFLERLHEAHCSGICSPDCPQGPLSASSRGPRASPPRWLFMALFRGDSFSFGKNAQWCMCTQRLLWKQVNRPLQYRPSQL